MHLIESDSNLNKRLETNRLRSLIKEAAQNKLKVAGKVIEVIDTWTEQDEKDACGMTPDGYLRKCFGCGCGTKFWRDRHNAVKYLGPEAVRYVDDKVAVWVKNNVPPHYREDVKLELCKMYRANSRLPMPYAASIARLKELMRLKDMAVTAAE